MLHLAVVGCGHGEIDQIYETVSRIEKNRQIKVSLVLCCGDFQSVRNMTDLRCMACPIKYQQMHDFHRYYSGEKVAPITTLFIGGNHEASNYLQELPYGGWVAPNIYYMSTGVLRFGSLRIAGISGIFKGVDYLRGRHECPPYDASTMRSVYHYRNLDIFRMKQIKTKLDIMISHDWPENIHEYGDTWELLRRKPFFRNDVEYGRLGSRPLAEVLFKLQPSYWFSAHLHVRFEATVLHENEIHNSESEVSPKVTRFLALDKILPHRHFLQVIDIPVIESSEEPKLSYDPEWLAILKSTNHLINVKPNPCFMPGPSSSQYRHEFTPTTEEIEEVSVLFDKNLEIPQNFSQTASFFEPGEHPGKAYPIENPQTTEFCTKLGISDPLRLNSAYVKSIGRKDTMSDCNPTSYRILDRNNETNERLVSTAGTPVSSAFTQASFNPDEIPLDEDEEDVGPKSAESVLVFMPQPSSSNFISGSPLPDFRKRLELPAPKRVSGDGEALQKNEITDATDARHLDILKSVFGPSSDFSSGNETPIDDGNGLFVLDRVGEPQHKRAKK